MIWGESWAQRAERFKREQKFPRRMYAWVPTLLTNGQWIWLDYFWKYRNGEYAQIYSADRPAWFQ